jgi:hypothetical protein
MRQTQKISGFVHSQAYVKAIACLVLACGGALPTLAASETLSNPKVEEAQQSEITVKGTVVDDAGEPVIGATIMEKGTRNGTVTDIDGNYVIKVKRNAQLTISYLGYATQVVPAGTSKVVLKSNDTKLNDVFVVFNVLLFCCFYIFFIVSSPSSVFPQRHESCRGFHFRRSRISEPFCHN